MKELLEFLLTKLATKPESVEVEEIEEDELVVTYKIKVHDDDKGRIIGKGGTNIKAIRSILSILARERNLRVYLKVE
ncbi:KH domain-containing protein [Candidatus Dojkabacteria bacterium]|nr:KH domain-containing protein [Candidatus Dojkabacteria bacterium]